MAKDKTPAPLPAPKPMAGRTKGRIKDDAREALPTGTPEALATKANEIALAEGYAPTISPEDFAPKPERKKRESREPSLPFSQEPTMSELRSVRAAIKEHGESLENVASMFDTLNKLSAFTGGNLDRLRQVVEFWQDEE